MNKEKIIRTIGILFILVIIFYIITGSITKYTGFFVSDINDFENCLEEKNITLYINSYDTVKTLNNFKTKDYLTHIEIFNCLLNRLVCDNNDIDSFPTWYIEGKKIN